MRLKSDRTIVAELALALVHVAACAASAPPASTEPRDTTVKGTIGSAEKHVEAAFEHVASQRCVEGEAECRHALNADPNLAAAYYCMGFVQAWCMRRPEGAVSYFERAVALRPDYADAHSSLAESLLRIEPPNYELACAHFESASKSDPAEESFSELSAMCRSGQATQILAFKESDALSMSRSIPGLSFRMVAQCLHDEALSFAAQGRTDLATKRWEAAIRLHPQFCPAHRELAVVDDQPPGDQRVARCRGLLECVDACTDATCPDFNARTGWTTELGKCRELLEGSDKDEQ